MKLSREDVIHITQLARLGVTEEEIDRFTGQLSDILENFEALKQIDTTGVPPTAQPIPLRNVLKEDVARESLPQDEILANAPEREGEFFRIRAVLE